MGNRVWRRMCVAVLGPVLLLFAGHAQAVSVERIEVASHLGEPFFAEVPLKLESNELPSKVFVDIAAPADYKIFEVYRDPVLTSIRADVASDARGVRVKLSSRSRINTPFFNLVLKIRYGRVSHFKKFPVFLDAAKSILQAANKAPQPVVEAVKQVAAAKPQTSLTQSAGQVIIPEPSTTAAKPENKYYDGWARTDRYGPIVRGDTLSTVAERLRIDYRYTRNQIMLALFEKNSSSFDQHNINLLKAGSRLKVPTAAEVEAHNKVEASRFLAEQEKIWKTLTQQPRYAAEAEAQRTRYTKRISIGEHADGVASAPVAVAEVAKSDSAAHSSQQQQLQQKSQTGTMQPATPVAGSTAMAQQEPTTQATPAKTDAADRIEQVMQAQNESSQILENLRQQNILFQQQLRDSQKSIEMLNRKVENDAATAAAAEARMEKLEMLISRLQSTLDNVDQQKTAPMAAGMDWVIWLLIALVVILLGVVAMMMRREPAHPATAVESSVADEPAGPAGPGQGDTPDAGVEQDPAVTEPADSDIPIAKETATIDSLPVFSDELSDTDTAELEPFDADATAAPDPDIDYLAEADVYIRYGMDDEAIKQLDMALRVQPDNVQAHIKKAELLLAKGEQSDLDESVAAATMALAAVDLEKFKTSIEKLGAETGQHIAEVDPQHIKQPHSEPDDAVEDTLPLETPAADELNFDLSDLDVPDIEEDKQQHAQEQADDSGVAESAEMSWLHDAAFDQDSPADAVQSSDAGDTDAIHTQELDNLLSEFPDAVGQPDQVQSVTTDVADATSTQELTDFGLTGGATQELDKLLTEFDDTSAVEQEDEPAGATRRLDQLLSEFDDDDDFVDTQHGLTASIFEQDKGTPEAATTASADVDIDHGATQELDSLLAEFSDADEDQLIIGDETGELDASFFEPDTTDAPARDDTTGMDTDHGATQELDNLLSEFANKDDATTDIEQADGADSDAGAADDEHSATQVLGHLLDEFNEGFTDDDDEADKKS